MKKAIVICLCVALCFSLLACESSDYANAIELYNNGEFATALALFEELDDYEDSSLYAKKCKLGQAQDAIKKAEYESALTILQELGDFENSGELVKECNYGIATILLEEKAYVEAIEILSELDGYKDCAQLISVAKWNALYDYIENEDGAITYTPMEKDTLLLEHSTLGLTTNDDDNIYLLAVDEYNTFGLVTYVTYLLVLRPNSDEADFLVEIDGEGVNTVKEKYSGTIKLSSFSPAMSIREGKFEQHVTKPNGDTEHSFDNDAATQHIFVEGLVGEDGSTLIVGTQERICNNLPLLLEKTGLNITVSDLGFAFEQ